jgi:hypothetical protein
MHIESIKVVTAKFNNSAGSTRLLRETTGEPLARSLMAAFRDGDELVIMRRDDWLGISAGLLPKPDSDMAVQLVLLARERLAADNSQGAQQLKVEMDSLVVRSKKETEDAEKESITR